MIHIDRLQFVVLHKYILWFQIYICDEIMLSASYNDTFVVVHQLFRDELELQSVFIAEHGLRIDNNGSSFFDTKKCYFVLVKDW